MCNMHEMLWAVTFATIHHKLGANICSCDWFTVVLPVVPLTFMSKSVFFCSYYACHHATYVLKNFLGSRSKSISSRMNLSSACCWGCSSASHRCASRRGRGRGRLCCQWLWASLVLGEKMLSKIYSVTPNGGLKRVKSSIFQLDWFVMSRTTFTSTPPTMGPTGLQPQNH